MGGKGGKGKGENDNQSQPIFITLNTRTNEPSTKYEGKTGTASTEQFTIANPEWKNKIFEVLFSCNATILVLYDVANFNS